jgi:hypothetical protein
MSDGGTRADHFSAVSSGYARFRPRYPKALFESIAALAPRRTLAWDCGAGTGQATLDLVDWFDHVIATDASAAQIAEAPEHPRISWRIAPAESTDIDPGTIDLVVVAQAFHWFDHQPFYREIRRVAAKDALVAIWSYGSVQLKGAVSEAVSHFEHRTVGAYWPAERARVYECYRGIDFPFAPVVVPPMQMAETWTRDHLLGYVRTWSATSRYVAANGTDPVIAFEAELSTLWSDVDEARTVTWPLTVIAGRV